MRPHSIRKLPDHLVNQIAAGEVVERPASALKELVENALDANATQIDITLHHGGKSLLIVTDNGTGMGADDLRLALERHATSKLPDDDLFHITTMGFRGEALPSIASVSRLTLTSGQGDAGFSIHVEGGKVGDIKPTPKRQGTRVEVRDLFYATPARLKFLKSDKAEQITCRDVIERLSLANPHVGLSVTGEQKSLMNLRPCKDLKDRIKDVLGDDFITNSITLDGQRDHYQIKGYVSLPTFSQATAKDQYLYVNNRPVKDKLLYVAIRAAYQDYLMQGRHPVVALYLSVPWADLDVNVHPAKTEVRFRDASFVRDFVVSQIRAALGGGAQKTSATLVDSTLQRMQPLNKSHPAPANSPVFSPSPYKNQSHPFSPSLMEAAAPLARHYIEEFQTADPVQQHYPLGAAVAQLHGNYIVAQTQTGLILVDQHAAHERIVYEQLKSGMTQHGIKRQILLIPEIVELPSAKHAALTDAITELEKLGLVLESYGENAVVVREIPALFGDGDIRGLVKDLSDELADAGHGFSLEKHLLNIAATLACHGSVRAGRKLNVHEMNALLRQMESTPNTGQCNHGRPTYIELKLGDIESLFKRS